VEVTILSEEPRGVLALDAARPEGGESSCRERRGG
jgi:hypothetical protein